MIEVDMGAAIDLILLFVEAGLPLAPAFKESAKILIRSQPDVARVLEATAGELEEDPDRNAVLLRLGARLGSSEAREVIDSLASALRYGTAPVRAFRDAAKMSFEMRAHELDQRLSRIPALAAVPLVLFSIPCILFVAWHFLAT
jgi:pilus assembly protein TadC